MLLSGSDSWEIDKEDLKLCVAVHSKLYSGVLLNGPHVVTLYIMYIKQLLKCLKHFTSLYNSATECQNRVRTVR